MIDLKTLALAAKDFPDRVPVNQYPSVHHKKIVAMQAFHAAASPDAILKLLEERDRLREALETIVAVMGPAIPPCCEGCSYEWGYSLKSAKLALEQAR